MTNLTLTHTVFSVIRMALNDNGNVNCNVENDNHLDDESKMETMKNR